MSYSQEIQFYTERDWESRKPRIEQLYITLGHPLEGPDGIMGMMAREGFTATYQQYQYRFRKWGFIKSRRRAGIIHGTQQREPPRIDQVVSRSRPQRSPHQCASEMLQGGRSDSYDYDGTTQAESRHMSDYASYEGTLPAQNSAAATTGADDAEADDIASSQVTQPLMCTDDSLDAATRDTMDWFRFDSNLPPPNTIGDFDPSLPPPHDTIGEFNDILPLYDTNDRALSTGWSPSNGSLPFGSFFPSC